MRAVAVVSLAVLGLVALAGCNSRGPRDPLAITATVTWTGTPAPRVDTEVVAPLAAALGKVERAKSTRGVASNGRAEVVVTFVPGSDPRAAQAAVLGAIDAVVPRLPREVEAPVVSYGEPRAPAPFWLRIIDASGTQTVAEVAERVRKVAVPRLERVAGVRKVEVRGAPVPQLTIQIDPARAASYGVTLGDVVPRLVTRPAATPEALDALVVLDRAEGSVQLKDIAVVKLVEQRTSGEPLGIAVWLQPRTTRLMAAEAFAALPPEPALQGITIEEMPAPDGLPTPPHAIELTGANREEVEAAAAKLAKSLVADRLATAAVPEPARPTSTTRTIAIDTARARALGVSDVELAPLAGVLVRRPVVPASGTRPAIVLVVADLAEVQVRGTAGLVPVSQLATFSDHPDRSIVTIDGQPAAVLRVTLATSVNVEQLREALVKRGMPPTATTGVRARVVIR